MINNNRQVCKREKEGDMQRNWNVGIFLDIKKEREEGEEAGKGKEGGEEGERNGIENGVQ
jgi:hypothetical protein